MNRDWTRTVAVLPDDGGQPHWICCQDGLLTVGEGRMDPSDLEIRAPGDVLEAVFSGTMAPTEPYNSGELMVRGSQDDLMRLDIITLLLWGA